MTFTKTSSKNDPVIIYTSENGLYKIIKRTSTGYILKRYSLFNMMGEVIGEYNTLEQAMMEA